MIFSSNQYKRNAMKKVSFTKVDWLTNISSVKSRRESESSAESSFSISCNSEGKNKSITTIHYREVNETTTLKVQEHEHCDLKKAIDFLNEQIKDSIPVD